MPDLPEGSEHKAYDELLRTVKQDHERWHRLSDEIEHRAALMGRQAAAESVLDDVRSNRL